MASCFRKYWICLGVLLNLLQIAQGSKCDSMVKIKSPEILSYLGTVTFHAPGTISHGKWTLNMTTTYPFTFIGGWGVTVTSHPKKGFAIFRNTKDVTVSKGDTISFRFRIHYAQVHSKKIPYVNFLKWEKWEVCSSRLQSPRPRTIKNNDFTRRMKTDHFWKKYGS